MNVPLIEKHRPTTFEEIKGITFLDNIKSLISNPSEMPNLLFHGPQGTGKTTLAKIIVKELKPIDVLVLNGSSKEDRNIETISNKLTGFGMSMSSVKGKPKLIFIDEVDNLTPDAFLAFRGTIEKVIKNARFICTANYLNKIPEPIQSRFSLFKFKKLETDDIFNKLIEIRNKENITVEGKSLELIAKSSNGDLRTAINALQCSIINGRLTPDQITNVTETKEVFHLILAKEWTKIRYDVPKLNLDYNHLLIELADLFFKIDATPVTIRDKADIITIISQGLIDMRMSFDKDICFSAICFKIIKVLDNFYDR